jgi:serine/threonine protein kinase
VELEQNVMVFDLLGPSVDALAGARGGGRLGLKSALLVVGQVLDSLEFVHSKLLVHRDIKPQNFLVGARGGPAAARVHLVDFGTSAPYRHPQTRAHAPWAQDATGMVGNALYASANAHQGVQLARRDDVESLSYVLVRFLKGALPWEGVDEGRTLQPHQIVALMRAKQAATPLAELCAGLPPEVGAFVAHARGLRYDQEPDYALLRKLLGAMMEREGHARDYVYDWDDSDVLAAAAK